MPIVCFAIQASCEHPLPGHFAPFAAWWRGGLPSLEGVSSVAPLGLVILSNLGPTADAVGYRLSVLRTCGLAPEETHEEAWSKAMPGSRFLEVEKLDLDTESDTRSS